MKMSVSIPDRLWYEALTYSPNKSKSVIVRLALQDFVETLKPAFFATYGANAQGYLAKFLSEQCNHTLDDGCCWCCEKCNLDQHRCPECGCITDHKNSICSDCVIP